MRPSNFQGSVAASAQNGEQAHPEFFVRLLIFSCGDDANLSRTRDALPSICWRCIGSRHAMRGPANFPLARRPGTIPEIALWYSWCHRKLFRRCRATERFCSCPPSAGSPVIHGRNRRCDFSCESASRHAMALPWRGCGNRICRLGRKAGHDHAHQQLSVALPPTSKRKSPTPLDAGWGSCQAEVAASRRPNRPASRARPWASRRATRSARAVSSMSRSLARRRTGSSSGAM